MVFWFGCADRQVKTRQSPFSVWDLAGKAILTQLGGRQNGNLSVIEWKYHKYIGTENFVDRTKRKSRRRSEKVSKIVGSESKATVLECMI